MQVFFLLVFLRGHCGLSMCISEKISIRKILFPGNYHSGIITKAILKKGGRFHECFFI